MTSTADPARTRRGRPGHSLDSLLDVAVAVFNERGYDATSMEELATRLGVTKSAIYHHVTSKVELLRLALDRALDELFARSEEHTSELQSRQYLVCRLMLEKKKITRPQIESQSIYAT